MNEEWIMGKNPVIEALKSGRPINKILMLESMEGRVQSQIVKSAKQQGVLVQKVPKHKLDQIAEHHQGVVASVAAYEYAEIDDLLENARKKMKLLF